MTESTKYPCKLRLLYLRRLTREKKPVFRCRVTWVPCVISYSWSFELSQGTLLFSHGLCWMFGDTKKNPFRFHTSCVINFEIMRSFVWTDHEKCAIWNWCFIFRQCGLRIWWLIVARMSFHVCSVASLVCLEIIHVIRILTTATGWFWPILISHCWLPSSRQECILVALTLIDYCKVINGNTIVVWNTVHQRIILEIMLFDTIIQHGRPIAPAEEQWKSKRCHDNDKIA